MSRAFMLALPLVTVLVVTYALLVAGVPRPVLGARVYGGPTEGVDTLSLRVESLSRDGESERSLGPGTVQVTVTSAGLPRVSSAVRRAAGGIADVTLELAQRNHGPLALEVSEGSRVLARGTVALATGAWAARARRAGGWIRGRSENELGVSIAAARGVFVVGVPGTLLVRVERTGLPAPGCTLALHGEGAKISSTRPLVTDANGRAEVTLEALEHNATLRVEVRAPDGVTTIIESGLPILPGGLSAELAPGGVLVRSALPPPERAFFSVVTAEARLLGGTIELTPDGHGGSLSSVRLPALPRPAWFVVSREVDEQSAAAVGWPLDSDGEPGRTFSVPEALLLDGLPRAFELEQARRSRVRWLTAAFALLSLLLSVALLFLRVRAAEQEIDLHLREGLEPATARRVAPARRLALLVALLVVGLGFLALGLLAAAR